MCYPQTVGTDDPQPLAYACDAIGEGEVVAPVLISDWSVNGVVGGNGNNLLVSNITITDEGLLEGTFNCPVSMFSAGLDASWTFTRQ